MSLDRPFNGLVNAPIHQIWINNALNDITCVLFVQSQFMKAYRKIYYIISLGVGMVVP